MQMCCVVDRVVLLYKATALLFVNTPVVNVVRCCREQHCAVAVEKIVKYLLVRYLR